jgi:hypothetical protein
MSRTIFKVGLTRWALAIAKTLALSQGIGTDRPRLRARRVAAIIRAKPESPVRRSRMRLA